MRWVKNAGDFNKVVDTQQKSHYYKIVSRYIWGSAKKRGPLLSAKGTSYKRKIILINPAFQIKFSILVSIILLLSNVVYPLVIYEYTDNFIILLQELRPDLSLEEERSTLIRTLILFQVIYTGLIFTLCIYFSHKIAGPLFKFKKYLAGIRKGDSNYRLSFRDGDYFMDLAREFNDTWDYLEDERKGNVKILSGVRKNFDNLESSISESGATAFRDMQKSLEGVQRRLNRGDSAPE